MDVVCLVGKYSFCGGHLVTPRDYCCVHPLKINIFKSRMTGIEKLNFLVVRNEDEQRGGINGELQSMHSRKKEIQRRNEERW